MLTVDMLAIDPSAEARNIEAAIRDQVLGQLRRRGAVVGISGGVDSAVVAALCARALGPGKVLGLLMPERDSSPDTTRLGRLAAQAAGLDPLLEEITPALNGFRCYERQREAIRSVFPAYAEGWRCKLSLPSVLDGDRFNLFQLTVQSPAGDLATARLPSKALLRLVAATNFKQRVRKMTEYFHADRLAYAVAGTPNKLEYELGFFVKQGDGAADFKPIAHLYKSQVYALAEYLGVPEEIRSRPPTTDTYSMEQTQEEFYFALAYAGMDLALYAYEHGIPAAEAAGALGLTAEQMERVYRDVEGKRRVAAYLHAPPLLVERGKSGLNGSEATAAEPITQAGLG